MADQGIWFKLHCSALDDPDLDNLPLADFGAWSKLGAYIKRHGTEGRLKITPPARALCSMFQVPDFTALMVTIHRLPHVQIRRVGEEGQSLPSPPVTDVTIQSVPYSVSYDNWLKYQGDFSSHRVRKFREKQRGEMLQMKRAKRRGEEKRREETRREENPPLSSPPTFQVPDPILKALGRAPKLGAVARLRLPAYWQAELRANPGVKFADEILKAEAYYTAHPEKHYKNLAAALHNWLKNADRPE